MAEPSKVSQTFFPRKLKWRLYPPLYNWGQETILLMWFSLWVQIQTDILLGFFSFLTVIDTSNILFQVRFYINIYYIDTLQNLHKGPWMSNDSYRTRTCWITYRWNRWIKFPSDYACISIFRGTSLEKNVFWIFVDTESLKIIMISGLLGRVCLTASPDPGQSRDKPTHVSTWGVPEGGPGGVHDSAALADNHAVPQVLSERGPPGLQLACVHTHGGLFLFSFPSERRTL